MPTQSVFLSYASEDAEAARRICEALLAAGIDVWFDQNELRGGEVWDRQIRDRIHDCRLFIAVISSNTESRDEGYFRREWRLAIDRTDDLAEDVPFLLPVAVEAIAQATARVPRKFREVQWTTLPDGTTSAEFVSRVARLLGRDVAIAAPPRGAVGEPVPARVPSAPGSPVQAFPGQAAPPHRLRLFALPNALIGLIVFAIGIGAYVWLEKSRGMPAPPAAISASAAKRGSSAVSDRSLAVLPFVDMSEKRDQEYFADGMSEEILDLLAKIPQLSVIGRTSSFQFKGKNEDLRTIGNKLNAAYVVEGSVRKSGSRIRVTSQLVDTRSGAHVWSESYDRDFGDTLILQDEIATSVARALELAVTSADPASRRRPPRSMEAYTLYLRGRVAFDRGDVAAYAEAEQDFQQALALDPSFAPAAEGVLISYINELYAGAVSSRIGWPRVQQFATRTLQLDPDSMFAHSALAWFHYSYDYDWSACNSEIDTVVAANTRDPSALLYAGYVAGSIGRSNDGTRLIREAIVLDPLNPDPHQGLGGVLTDEGDYDGAERAYRRSLELSPSISGSHLYIGAVRLFRGMPKKALPEIEAEPAGPGRDALLAAAYFALGRRRESDAKLDELLKSTADDSVMWIAFAHALRKENDLAFQWLDKAYAERGLSLNMGRSHYLTSLHGDPRWKPFLRRLNIPE